MDPWCLRNMVAEYFSNFQSGTRHALHERLNHLFRNHLAARLFLELLMIKVRLQCVVTLAWSPIFSMVRIPCRTPLRDGHSLILSINLNSSTRFR